MTGLAPFHPLTPQVPRIAAEAIYEPIHGRNGNGPHPREPNPQK